MNHIVVSLQPFTLKQNIFVYINGACIKQTSVEVDRIVDVVNGLSKQYNIKQIDLCGNQDYLLHFQTEMDSKFANNEYNIEIIRR